MKIPVSKDENMTLNTYLDEESSPWWNYIIGFPSMVIGGIKSLFTEKMMNQWLLVESIKVQLSYLKRVEADWYVEKKITATVDKNTYMTSVTVTLQNPRVAAVVADSVVKKLQEYIIGYRTSKAKEDCIYLEKLFKERQQEYYTAQKNMLIIWILMIISYCRVSEQNRKGYRAIWVWPIKCTVRWQANFRLPELKFRRKSLYLLS